MRIIGFLSATGMLISLAFSQNYSNREFSVMSYNAENLYDTVHDEGIGDYEYLPLQLKRTQYVNEVEKQCAGKSPVGSRGFLRCKNLDWNPQVLDKKLQNIAFAIGMYNNGKGADIVVMQEVENQNVMNLLLQKLKPMGFKQALILEDKDPRGIDVSIVSKFPILSSKIHSGAPNSNVKRGIYQFNLSINNKVVSILGNHWPSMHNPAGHRMNASKLFETVSANIPAGNIVIAMGDFNTLDTETPNAIQAITDTHFDSRPEAERAGTVIFPGTYKYDGEWQVLDRILVRKSDVQSGKVKPVFKSFEVINNKYLLGQAPVPQNNGRINVNPNTRSRFGNGNSGGESFMTTQSSLNLFEINEDPSNGAPIRFNPQNGQGFSDHLPVAMKFNL